MQVFQLVETTTKDGLIHQGIFFSPKQHGNKAILWVHGLTGKFYGDVTRMNAFASICEKEGFGFASFNTRGHDMIAGFHRSDTLHSYQTVGAGIESFEECIFDIDAAVSYLVSQGFSEVVLVGHSTGANKACYYGATKPDSRVAGIVLSGPMSDRYSSGYSTEQYAQYKAFMQEKIIEGKGDEPLSGYDFFVLTPNRWMSLYTAGSTEDVFNYADGHTALKTFSKISQPLFVVLAEQDEHATMPMREIQKLFDIHAKSVNYKSILIPGASHGFDGKEKELVLAICNWIQSIDN